METEDHSTPTSSIPTPAKTTMHNHDGPSNSRERSHPSSSSRPGHRGKSKKSKESKKSRQSKKARLNEPTNPGTDPASHAYTLQTDPLTTLPLELLGEILVRTRSTRDIITVALCSKHLRKTLTGSPAAFIWKRTRQVAVPDPLPDPPVSQRLSEHAYAVMVYGGGLCEVSHQLGPLDQAYDRHSAIDMKFCALFAGYDWWHQFCKVYTKEMYTSFALKLRICRSVSSCFWFMCNTKMKS